jgi:anti-sigma factor RsiW
MNNEAQLKLQAFLDGELPDKEAGEVAAWLARDAEVTALSNELRNTRKAIKACAPKVNLPESREFYWSKIKREIDRLGPAQERVKATPMFGLLRRMLIPAATLAGLAVVVIAGLQGGIFGPSARPDSEMTVADSGAFTYHDFANGTTLVWVSYPAER